MALKDVKNHLSEVVDQVEREHDRVVVTKHGRPAAVMLSVDDLSSLEESLEIMGRPRLVAQIRDSLAELVQDQAGVLTKEQALGLLRRCTPRRSTSASPRLPAVPSSGCPPRLARP
ncbi:MAG: type II toxin-antitoxin system Phd/YefM family antitoxin [Ornithinimicrobium sp.]